MTYKIWTDDEYVEVNPHDIGELSDAMRFKATNIKAKADPGLFMAVSDALDNLWALLDDVHDKYAKLDSALDKACTKLFDEATVMGDCEDEYSFAHSPRDWKEWALGMEVHDSGEND